MGGVFSFFIIIYLFICLFIFSRKKPKPFLFKGDHRLSLADPDAPVVILYAEVGTKEFAKFHHHMLARANKGLITYVLRHYLSVSVLDFR